MQDAFTHCEQLVRSGDKDRFLATLFAPEKYRRALFALYAFNLEVARVREVAREPMPGEVRLQWWADVLSGTGRGEVAANPVAAALREVVVRFRLPPQMLADLIEARRFDLYDEPMPSMAALELYAAKTSSSVIELAARILNDGRDPGLSDLTRHAGIAYAIAGLLRAFPIHAARRQLYVPVEVLQRHRAQLEDVFSEKADARIARGARRDAAARPPASCRRARIARQNAGLRRSGLAAGGAGAAGVGANGAAVLPPIPPFGHRTMAPAMDSLARGALRVSKHAL